MHGYFINFRGILACIVVFLAFGVTQAKDGPFLRPHPGILNSEKMKLSFIVYFFFFIC